MSSGFCKRATLRSVRMCQLYRKSAKGTRQDRTEAKIREMRSRLPHAIKNSRVAESAPDAVRQTLALASK